MPPKGAIPTQPGQRHSDCGLSGAHSGRRCRPCCGSGTAIAYIPAALRRVNAGRRILKYQALGRGQPSSSPRSDRKISGCGFPRLISGSSPVTTHCKDPEPFSVPRNLQIEIIAVRTGSHRLRYARLVQMHCQPDRSRQRFRLRKQFGQKMLAGFEVFRYRHRQLK